MAFHHWLLLFFFFSIGCGRPVEKYEIFDFSLKTKFDPGLLLLIDPRYFFYFFVLFFILFCLLHTISVWDIFVPPLFSCFSLLGPAVFDHHTYNTHTHTQKGDNEKPSIISPPPQHHPHHFSPFSWRMSHSPGLGLGVSRSARKRCCRAHLISFLFCSVLRDPGKFKTLCVLSSTRRERGGGRRRGET
jgi:hypothetical protein